MTAEGLIVAACTLPAIANLVHAAEVDKANDQLARAAWRVSAFMQGAPIGVLLYALACWIF